jgi:hypothetical protein
VKRKFSLPLLLIFISFKAICQPIGYFSFDSKNTFESNYPSRNNSLGLSGDVLFGSNCITTKFANNYIGNLFLDTTLKNNVSSRLGSDNHFGYDLDGGLFYTHKLDTFLHIPISSYYLAIRDRNHSDANFPKDLFNLTFFGNEMYAGKTANLSNLSFNSIHYQQIQFGLIKEYPAYHASYTVGVSISGLKGQSSLNITTGSDSLFTQIAGEYLNLTANMNMRQSDTSGSNYSSFNGWGLSTDFFVSFHDSLSNFTVRLDVQDLGFINWFKAIQNNIDTSFQFSGLEVPNILQPGDSLSNLSLDSNYTKAYHAHQVKKSYTTFLPALINLSLSMFLDPDKKIPLEAGVNFRFSSNYTPYIYAGVSKFFNKTTIAGATISYGGYGRFGFGLNFGKDFGHGVILMVRTNNFESLLLPNSATGETLLFGFKKTF